MAYQERGSLSEDLRRKVVDQLVNEFPDTDPRAIQLCVAPAEPLRLEQCRDDLLHLRYFCFHARRVLVVVDEFELQPHPGQRCPQFMGDSEQKCPLGVEHALDVVRQLVDVVGEIAELIVPEGVEASTPDPNLDNNSDDAATIEYLETEAAAGRIRLLKYPHPFNFSAINNFAVQYAEGQLLAFMNNDLEVIAASLRPNTSVVWLESPGTMMFRLLDVARSVGARMLFVSTSEVYGDPLEHPQTEGYHGNVNPVGERSCYDEAKRFAEAITMAYHRHHGVDTRIVRIFNTYGPRMHPNDGRVISNFIVQALLNLDITVYGDGRQTRSFCFVDDLIDGLFRLMNSPDDFTGPVNIGMPPERANSLCP